MSENIVAGQLTIYDKFSHFPHYCMHIMVWITVTTRTILSILSSLHWYVKVNSLIREIQTLQLSTWWLDILRWWSNLTITLNLHAYLWCHCVKKFIRWIDTKTPKIFNWKLYLINLILYLTANVLYLYLFQRNPRFFFIFKVINLISF